MCQTLSFVFDPLCPRLSMLPGSPLDFGALDKRIVQRAITRKNQCNLGKTCPSDSFFGLVHQAGTIKSYIISSVFPQEMKMPSSAQFPVPILHRGLTLTPSSTSQATSNGISRGRKEKIQDAGTYTKAYRQQVPLSIHSQPWSQPAATFHKLEAWPLCG
jgi:hypothetical protein